MSNYSEISNCPITGHDEKVKYFDLGNIPLVNNLASSREEAINAERYPLNINYYPASGESSLSIAINGDLLFSNYLFKSGVNQPYIEHCRKMFLHIQEYVKVRDYTRIIDIGGNDGTLLDAFKSCTDREIYLLNIDPSVNLGDLSTQKGIPCKNEFFSYDVAKTISKWPFEKVDIITSTNVFQHLQDINSFVKGVEYLLEDNGVWVLEFPYWIHDMKTNQFDQIYHEHVYYHSITPLKMLMEKHGLKIVNITKQNIHGGTLRLIIAKKKSRFIPDITIEAYLQLERHYGLDYHTKWGSDVQEYINLTKNYLRKFIQMYKVYGFGAAAKGCIYLNAINISYKDIPYIIDDTDIKQSKFIPGIGAEVVSREILKTDPPDYILILAHNFKDYIIESLRNDGYKGQFIVLLPQIEII